MQRIGDNIMREKVILEDKIKDEVKKILRNNNVQFFMPCSNKFGRSGVSDFICCFYGQYIAIETKSPAASKKENNGMSAMQVEFFKKVRDANGICLCVYDDETLGKLDNYLSTVANHLSGLVQEVEILENGFLSDETI